MENNSYCSLCNSCGEESCCSPLNCKMNGDCKFGATYLKDLKFGFYLNEWVQKNFLDEDKLSKENIEIYNEEWNRAYDRFYGVTRENNG
jgi:hypothetical protein